MAKTENKIKVKDIVDNKSVYYHGEFQIREYDEENDETKSVFDSRFDEMDFAEDYFEKEVVYMTIGNDIYNKAPVLILEYNK